jgi:hypothetical protein
LFRLAPVGDALFYFHTEWQPVCVRKFLRVITPKIQQAQGVTQGAFVVDTYNDLSFGLGIGFKDDRDGEKRVCFRDVFTPPVEPRRGSVCVVQDASPLGRQLIGPNETRRPHDSQQDEQREQEGY